MKTSMKIMSAVLCGVLLCGCSMNEDSSDGTTNQSNTEKPTPPVDEGNTNMDDMMTYLKDNGIEYSDMASIDQMDFAAHEGRSFMTNGATAYMYRLDSNDASMSELLKQATESGTITTNQNGEQKQYNASVNGNYLLVYDTTTDMTNFTKAFAAYKPNTTVQDPNTMGAHDGTAPNPGNENNAED